mgnify:CR=1 FL=1
MEYRYKPGDRVVVINEIRENGDYYMRSGSQHPHANVICVSESTDSRTKKLWRERLSRFLSIVAIDISSKKRIRKSCGQIDMFVGLGERKRVLL